MRDHSEDFEIHQTKDGKIFGIKNLKIYPEEGNVQAQISGDSLEAMKYIQEYANQVIENLLSKDKS